MTLCCVSLGTDETLSQDCPERWSGPSLFLFHMLPESFSEFYSSPHFPLNLTSPPLLINQVSLPICQLITEISERICAITEHLDFQVLRLWLIALQDSHLFLFYIWPSFLQQVSLLSMGSSQEVPGLLVEGEEFIIWVSLKKHTPYSTIGSCSATLGLIFTYCLLGVLLFHAHWDDSCTKDPIFIIVTHCCRPSGLISQHSRHKNIVT